MNFSENFNCDAFIGHRTLLYGNLNTKKTYYTALFVQFLLEAKKVDPKKITILYFAPKLFKFYNVKIGGKIEDFYPFSIKCKNISFKGDIFPVIISSDNKISCENACNNYKRLHEILNIYYENPTSILIINDISYYLHLGNKKFVLKIIKESDTFFGNSHYSSSMSKDLNNLFNRKEKYCVEFLIKKIDFAYLTD